MLKGIKKKTNMKILILSQYFYPDITAAAFRIGETADLLLHKGHDVRVITANPHKAQAQNAEGSHAVPEEKIYRARVKQIQKSGLLDYLLHYVSFMLGGMWQGCKVLMSRWRPDIIWASSPPLFVGVVGYVLSKLFGCPWVLDVRDVWPDSAVAAGQLSASGKGYKISEKIELFLYRHANSVSCVSQPMANYIANKSGKNPRVVYNGGTGNSFLDSVKKVQKKNIITYAGNIGLVQGVDVLVNGFIQLRSEGYLNDWEVNIIGAGVHRDRLIKLANDSQYREQIKFISPLAKKDVFLYLAHSRMLFLNLDDNPVFRLTIPSKVFDYMMADVPILAGIEGEGREILQSTGGNLSFHPGDVCDFQEKFLKLKNNIVEYERCAQDNSQVVLENYTRERSVSNLEELLVQECC